MEVQPCVPPNAWPSAADGTATDTDGGSCVSVPASAAQQSAAIGSSMRLVYRNHHNQVPNRG
eukprot:6010602-Prymnesium_polylepis.1